MRRVSSHLRANAMAYLALFVALGGSSYAAFRLPAGSVGTSQLKNRSVTPIKFASKVGAYVRAWAEIQGGTRVVAARPRARILDWDSASASGDLSWGSKISTNCFPMATGGGAFVQATLRNHFRGVPAVIHFGTSNNSGQPNASTASLVFIAVLCSG
jgi:hypothetical protein